MANAWFYQSGGQQRGPISLARLRLLVQQRELTSVDMVRPSTTDHWSRAGSVAELRAEMSPADLDEHSASHDGPAKADELLSNASASRVTEPSSSRTREPVQQVRLDNRSGLDALLDELPDIDELLVDASVSEGRGNSANRSETLLQERRPDGYYCWVLGTEFGPLSLDETGSMVERGELSPDDLVRRGRQGEWIEAQNVAVLQRFFRRVASEVSDDSGRRWELSYDDMINSAADATPADLEGTQCSRQPREPDERRNTPPRKDAASQTGESPSEAPAPASTSAPVQPTARQPVPEAESKPSTRPVKVKVKRPVQPVKSKQQINRAKAKRPITRFKRKPSVKTAASKPSAAVVKSTGSESPKAQRTSRPVQKKLRMRAARHHGSLTEKFGGNRLLLAIAAVLILAGGIAFILQPGDSEPSAPAVTVNERPRSFSSEAIDQEFYDAYKIYSTVWNEYLELREREPSAAEWTQFTSEFVRKVQPVLPGLATSKDPAKLKLYRTGLNYLLPILTSESAREQPSHLEGSLTRQLEDAQHAAQQAGYAAPSS